MPRYIAVRAGALGAVDFAVQEHWIIIDGDAIGVLIADHREIGLGHRIKPEADVLDGIASIRVSCGLNHTSVIVNG